MKFTTITTPTNITTNDDKIIVLMIIPEKGATGVCRRFVTGFFSLKLIYIYNEYLNKIIIVSKSQGIFCILFSWTDGSSNIGQMTRPSNSQQKRELGVLWTLTFWLTTG